MSNQELAQKIKNEGFIGINNLKESFDKLTISYLGIYLQTNALLEQYFSERKNSTISHPIDFIDLANYLGIKVEPKDLNYFNSAKNAYHLSRLENKDCIVFDRKTLRLQTNYSICYQIANYLYKKENITCRDAKLFSTSEETIVDTIASFLILPPIVTFNEMDQYMKQANRCVELNELFMHLSVKIQMPQYKVITSYEKLKVLGYYFNSSIQTKETLIDKYLNEEELTPLKDDAIKTLQYKNKISHTLFL